MLKRVSNNSNVHCTGSKPEERCKMGNCSRWPMVHRGSHGCGFQ